MALLSEPHEYLDLAHGDSARIQVERFELGEAVIHPTAPTPKQVAIYMAQNNLSAPPAHGTPIAIRIPVLRVFGKRLDRPSPAPYFDISSKTLQAQLLPLLQVPGFRMRTFTITGLGTRPMKRYQLSAA